MFISNRDEVSEYLTMKMPHKTSHLIFKVLLIFGLVSLSAFNASCQTQINPSGTEQHSLKDCVVPYLEGTSYYRPGCSNSRSDCSVESGQSIAGNGTVLRLMCEDTFILRQKFVDMAVCYNGEWYPEKHSCLKTCSGITLDTLDKNCTYFGKSVSCETDVRTGTKATLSCKPGFQIDRDYQENYCQETGKWLFMMNNCAPICGEVDNDENDRNRKNEIFRNRIGPVDASHAPWNAGVYLAENGTYQLICGGTLISEEFIITATNCVHDESGSVKPPSVFRVALGKTYKDWNDARDLMTAQNFNVREILSSNLFEDFFSGSSDIIDFARHIVVLRIIGMVNFNIFVAPVCLDIERYNRLYTTLIGTVVGWDINNETSVTLTKFRKPVETNAVCKEKLKPYEKIDNPSKFCTQRIEQLEGYYGAGLTFKDRGTQKYYVIGILTDHFEEVSVYLGYRDKTSVAIINAMKIHFDRAKNFKSIQ